jgi:hypothetical protein
MRAGAWLVLVLGLSCPLSSCSGGYPLPPTPCDELCHVTRGLNCSDDYDPAACVLACEDLHLSADECRPYFDAQLDCFRRNPGAARDLCYYYTPGLHGRCETESGLLSACAATLNMSYGLDY